MSAVKDEAEPSADPNLPGNRVHKFVQKIPIQSYLVAIAAGNLTSKKIGPRSRVWSEAEYVDKAAYDFEDTEDLISIADGLIMSYTNIQSQILRAWKFIYALKSNKVTVI